MVREVQVEQLVSASHRRPPNERQTKERNQRERERVGWREGYKRERREKGQGSEEEMANWKRVKEESVRDLGMLLMVDDDDRSAWREGEEVWWRRQWPAFIQRRDGERRRRFAFRRWCCVGVGLARFSDLA